MQTVLRMTALEDQITILAIGDELAVVGILDITDRNVHVRHSLDEFRELIEERTREIKCFSVRMRIPLVAPPVAMVVHDDFSLWSIRGNDLLAGEVAFPMIETPFIPMCMSSLSSAIRTEFWRRDVVPLVSDHRRHFFVEREIIFRNLKCCRTLCAGFLHQ